MGEGRSSSAGVNINRIFLDRREEGEKAILGGEGEVVIRSEWERSTGFANDLSFGQGRLVHFSLFQAPS